jgi:small subunit ribosomal protein S3
MGQKIHPIGLRIGIVQKTKSQWFAHPRTGQYSHIVSQDKLVRDFFAKELLDAGLSKVLISRQPERLLIELFVGQPKLVLSENGTRFKELTQKLQKILAKASLESYSRISDTQHADSYIQPALSIQVIQIPQEEIATDATLLAQKVAEQLEKRVAFRRVIKQSIQQARAAGAAGIKIKIAGRLNGAEIARSEWAREGRVPLQTLRANLDYCYHTAQTIYGVLGIKIWIFKGTP